MTTVTTPGAAMAVVEIESIARGYVVLDAIAKRAPVTVKVARAVTPGKFVIVFRGDVASVEESLDAAREHAGSLIVDECFLPAVHDAVIPAMDGALSPAQGDALGFVETRTIASAIKAADAAMKCSDISVERMRLAVGIGGKGVFSISGPIADVEAALDAARMVIGEDKLVGVEIIAQPHVEVRGFLSS